jgi:methionyl-tRNA synthetase
MAAGLPLPKQIFGHGWLLLDTGKMSKSKGNVVDPLLLIEKYGVNSIRYFLLREIPAGADGYYSEEALVQRINMDLANDYGNLVSRTVAMVEKYFDAIVPAPICVGNYDNELLELAKTLPDEVANFMDKLDFSSALGAIWRLVGRANKYIDETMPWALAKDPEAKDRLGTVLYNLIESIRIVTVMITPVMPTLPGQIWKQLGINPTENENWTATSWGGTKPGQKVSKTQALFPRIDWKDMSNEMPKNSLPVSNEGSEVKVEISPLLTEEITIDDFAKLDLRVAEVITCEKVEKADKLLKLEVRIGEETRTIVAGVAKFYKPEEMVGKKVIVIANLKPVKLRGITSQGMILAASNGDDLELLSVTKDQLIGCRVK